MEAAVIEKETLTQEADESFRIYEIGYVLVPTQKEDEVEAAVGKIRAMIEKADGKFLAEGAPSLQRLAYLISGREKGKQAEYDRGYFGWIKFEAPVESAAPLEKALREMEGVMRAILFKTVREETRARFKTGSIREVRRVDILKAAPRAEEVAAPVSEEDLDKAIEDITAE